MLLLLLCKRSWGLLFHAEVSCLESSAPPLALPSLPRRSTNGVPSPISRARFMHLIDQAMQDPPIFEIYPRLNAQITSSSKPLLLHQPHCSIRLFGLHVSCLFPLLYLPILRRLPLECNDPRLRRQWPILPFHASIQKNARAGHST